MSLASIAAILYVIRPTVTGFVDSAWVVTRFEGSILFGSVSPCGWEYIKERYALTGKAVPA